LGALQQKAGMNELIEGYKRFKTSTWRVARDLFERLAEGQSPRTLVITCCDSRVDPQMIFDAAPGEMFTIRNVANLVPPYHPDSEYHGTSAALEFAVRFLKVERIVVMGHGQCGGISALLGDGTPSTDFIGAWMQIAQPIRDEVLAKAGGDKAKAQFLGEQGAVHVSLQNLMTFPWVRERVEAGELKLFGCHFAIATGELLMLSGNSPEPAF
jgi:carbonic anhydrase